MDYYNLILALHMTAVSIWIFSMLLFSIIMAALADGVSKPGTAVTLARLRKLGRDVVTPAMVVTWILGGTLVAEGGWLGSAWLTAKLALVVALSAIHGLEMRTVRRLSTEPASSVSVAVRVMPIVIVFLVLMVLWLVMVKPF